MAIEEQDPRSLSKYKVMDRWYLEIIIDHPEDAADPKQSFTIPCDNEWWANFLIECIEGMTLQDYQLFTTANRFVYEKR